MSRYFVALIDDGLENQARLASELAGLEAFLGEDDGIAFWVFSDNERIVIGTQSLQRHGTFAESSQLANDPAVGVKILTSSNNWVQKVKTAMGRAL